MKRTILYTSLLITLGIGQQSLAQTRSTQLHQSAPAQPTSAWTQLPTNEADFGKGVSGHIAAMLKYGEQGRDSLLVVAGGCNFPDLPVSEGGARKFYSSVYGLNNNKEWAQLGEVPQAFAYAAWATTADRTAIVVAGGRGDQGDMTGAYTLWLNRSGELVRSALPPLPEGRSGGAGAVSGERFYVVGGQINGKPSNSMLSISLTHPEEGWRAEKPYTQKPLLKVLASGTASGRVYLIGSITGFEGNRPARLDLTFLCYDIATSTWSSLPLPKGLDQRRTAFGGGMICATDNGFVVAGGVCPEVFVPALRREQKLRKAKARGNSRRIDALTQAGKEYLLQPADWYRFSPEAWHYNDATARWTRLPDSPNLSRADGVLAKPYLMIGGELKPGVRTPDIHVYLIP